MLSTLRKRSCIADSNVEWTGHNTATDSGQAFSDLSFVCLPLSEPTGHHSFSPDGPLVSSTNHMLHLTYSRVAPGLRHDLLADEVTVYLGNLGAPFKSGLGMMNDPEQLPTPDVDEGLYSVTKRVNRRPHNYQSSDSFVPDSSSSTLSKKHSCLAPG